MRTTRFPYRKTLLVSAVLGVLSGAPVYAEDAPDAENAATEEQQKSGAEVIEVTARRYKESIKDVPVAVTALSEQKLMDKGTQTLIDIERFVPNLTVNASRATSTTLTAYIRGVGQNDPLWGFEPGVGLYIDDVYVARPQGGVLDLLDIQRVEILRGPQGTLYGKNTMGGAIKYVTRDLPDYTRGYVEGVIGSYNQRDVKAGFSTPITDTLLIGISAANLTRNGFGEVVGPSPFAGTDVSDKDITAARVNVTWKPSDTVTVKFVADDTQDDSNVRGGHRLDTSPTTGDAPLEDVFDTRQNMDPKRQEVTSSGQALTISWAMSDDWEFKSVTAQREGDTLSDIDFDATQINSFDVPAIYQDEQFTQEFQLTYTGERLDFVSGVYYLDGDACGNFDVVFGLVPLVQTTYGCVNTVSKSLYAQASYRFDDAWSMTLGARYDEDDKEATVGVNRFLGLPGTVILPLPGGEFTESETFDDFSPRVGVEYRASENTMWYFSYSHGFKSGGFNMRANPALDPAANQAFQPETADSFELGFKGSFLDNRVQTYVALFTQKYEDKQVPVSVVLPGGGFVSRVLNAADADLNGLELELNARITDDFSLFLMYGYLDAEYNEFVGSLGVDGSVTSDLSDVARVINAPENQYTIGLSYELEAGPGRLLMSTDYAWRDDLFIYDVSPLTDQEAYGVWNASVVYYLADSGWRFALHGRNLADEEYRTAAYDFSTTAVADSLLTGYYGDPMNWSLSAMYSF